MSLPPHHRGIIILGHPTLRDMRTGVLRERAPIQSRSHVLDRITTQMLAEFAQENELSDLPEDKQFEHLAAFSVIRRHYSRAFSTFDVVFGGGGDAGIDAIAIIVNNVLVTDVDQIEELVAKNDYLDATFVFIQAERSASFSAAKVGTFGFGVLDFFAETPTLPRSDEVRELAEITSAILARASKMKPAKAILYYVTTGLWGNEAAIVARVDNVLADVTGLAIFKAPEMLCFGASDLHEAYRRTRAPVTREFIFDRRSEVPATEGVIQASIGFVPYSEFRKLVADESGTEILTSIFEDNIRDWQGYKTVNSGMAKTLNSHERSKFVLMNNGVTIIARELNQVGNKFTISDYQIVNGCQTSNVLFEQGVGDDVCVPLRLIHTADDSIKNLITTATNSQTEIKPDQFASSRKFARKLEAYFDTYPEPDRLYYERRDGQYDRIATVPKSRIIDTPTVLRSFASIFWEVPHTATRNYKSIRDQIGDSIFVENHREVAYYYAALAWFTLDQFYSKKVIDRGYKSARFHLLLAVHLMIDNGPKPLPNSKAIEQRAEKGIQALSDNEAAEVLFKRAAKLIEEFTGGDLDRDIVRTETVTNAIIARLRPVPGGTLKPLTAD